MKRTIAGAALLAVPLAFSLAAGAQAQGDAAKPFSAQVGLGLLTSSSGKDATSSTGLHVGLGYAFPTTNPETKGTPSVDLDYNHASGHGNRIDAYGITAVDRFRFTQTGKVGAPIPYVGIGIGIFQDDMRVSRTTTTTTSTPSGSNTPGSSSTTTTTSKKKTQLGGKILAGLEFQSGYFVEASYIVSGSAAGVWGDSLNFSVGMNF